VFQIISTRATKLKPTDYPGDFTQRASIHKLLVIMLSALTGN